MLNTTIAKGYKYHKFILTLEEEVTVDLAMQEQKRLGYHPAGYGFYSFELTLNEDNTYTATWECAASCD